MGGPMTKSQQLDLFADEPVPASIITGYAEIVFNRPLDHAYTYAVPAEWRSDLTVGKRVLVPFGKGDKATMGFCVGLTDQAPKRAAKNIAQVLDTEPLVTPALMKLTRWMADYYVCGWGQVLN